MVNKQAINDRYFGMNLLFFIEKRPFVLFSVTAWVDLESWTLFVDLGPGTQEFFVEKVAEVEKGRM
jgi:hypothetical protein